MTQQTNQNENTARKRITGDFNIKQTSKGYSGNPNSCLGKINNCVFKEACNVLIMYICVCMTEIGMGEQILIMLKGRSHLIDQKTHKTNSQHERNDTNI